MALDVKRLVYGVFVALLLLLSSTLGTIVLVTPTLPVIFLSPKISRRIMDFLIRLWFIVSVAMYEMLMGVKVVIKGKPSLRGTSSLILANHRTRLDWLFLMSYLIRYSDIKEYRISLKAPLKKFPGAGWAMQCAGFLFLKRRWDEDKQHISNGLNYFSKVDSKPQFLLFPEGTDMCPNSIKRSNDFAEKMNLPKYEYVLHPRTTGFIHFVKEMKKGKILDSILDVTVGYPKNITHSELDTLKGDYPEEIHFYVEDFPISSLPDTDAELEEWVQKLWAKKEERLKRFYAEKSFDSTSDENENTSIQKVSEQSSQTVKPLSESAVKRCLYSVVLFWLTLLLVVFTALWISPLFRLYFLIGCITYVIIGIRHGGVDNVIYTAVRHHE